MGIVNAVVLNATNGPAEGVNSRIQAVKARCRGFRNQDRFAAAILFHLGGLDLSAACPALNCRARPPARSDSTPPHHIRRRAVKEIRAARIADVPQL